MEGVMNWGKSREKNTFETFSPVLHLFNVKLLSKWRFRPWAMPRSLIRKRYSPKSFFSFSFPSLCCLYFFLLSCLFPFIHCPSFLLPLRCSFLPLSILPSFFCNLIYCSAYIAHFTCALQSLEYLLYGTRFYKQELSSFEVFPSFICLSIICLHFSHCNLLDKLPIPLSGDGDVQIDHLFLTHLVNGYQQLLAAELLFEALQAQVKPVLEWNFILLATDFLASRALDC